jgi:hypothetical protein
LLMVKKEDVTEGKKEKTAGHVLYHEPDRMG